MNSVDYESQARQWCQRLNIEYNENIIPCYIAGINLYKEKGLFVIDKKRLVDYNEKYSIFRKWFDDVLLACDDIYQNEDLIIYIYVFVALILHKESISILKEPNFNCRATDYVTLFAFMYFLDDMISSMKDKGCSYQIISDTLNGFDSEMTFYYYTHGRGGVRGYASWFMLFLNNEIFRIGRLQFQICKLRRKIRVYEKNGDIKILMDGEYMHPKGMVFGSAMQDNEDEKYFADISEDDEKVTGYAVNELGECVPEKITLVGYREVLKSGDWVLSVHIASDGPLDYSLCEKSYEEAESFFAKAYPKYDFKSFVCVSWLMEKRLKEVIGEETNITKFSDEYYSCPILSQGKSVYHLVFHVGAEQAVHKLPETTSLQKKIKKYYSNGNLIYDKCGIRLFKNK